MKKPSNFLFWLNMAWSVVGSLCMGFIAVSEGYSDKLSIGLAISIFFGIHVSFWVYYWVMTSDRFDE